MTHVRALGLAGILALLWTVAGCGSDDASEERSTTAVDSNTPYGPSEGTGATAAPRVAEGLNTSNPSGPSGGDAPASGAGMLAPSPNPSSSGVPFAADSATSDAPAGQAPVSP